jgi:Rrf2 family protein
LADYQGIPQAYLAKIMTRLEKAGLVVANEGKGGGYRLGRPAEQITFLAVTDAVEGRKSLFQCTEVRLRCVLYGGRPPKSIGDKPCAIHAVMLAAERSLHAQLAATTVADIVRPLDAGTSPAMKAMALRWFAEHAANTSSKPVTEQKKKRKI